jgi:hypothetical protein
VSIVDATMKARDLNVPYIEISAKDKVDVVFLHLMSMMERGTSLIVVKSMIMIMIIISLLLLSLIINYYQLIYY